MPFSQIGYDFVTGLPEADGYNALMVVTDYFSKYVILIPIRDTLDSDEQADLFVNHVFSRFGLPDSIVSDRGPTMVSNMWKAFCERLLIQQRVSMAYHPQTDGLTERTNQEVEILLRIYASEDQQNWARLLPLVQYSYNDAVKIATGETPFYVLHGYHPRFVQECPPEGYAAYRYVDASAGDRVQALRELREKVSASIVEAQERYTKTYNRRHLPSPAYKPGDLVYVDIRRFSTAHPSAKLDYRRVGPFEVEKAVGKNAFKVKIPSSIRIHPVFHTSFLEPDDHTTTFKDGTVMHSGAQPEPYETVVADKEWEVARIVDSKRKGRDWEPSKHLENTPKRFRSLSPQVIPPLHHAPVNCSSAPPHLPTAPKEVEKANEVKKAKEVTPRRSQRLLRKVF
ncbi:hypothetical protein B9479_007043 [Cryptococcus floricola]|uniref:Integrase catalytic domain-containing protein n=1 Tax=Cryptococcus floricola TaxID=2591691 RepID=A0A5D3APW3_9TREE|nr:hypothetical protein B9479_007043 [Cryptococcus floricola]